MFDHFVWSVIVVPPLIVVVVSLVADRLPPGRAAVVLAWSGVWVAAGSVVNLALFTVTALAELPVIADPAGWSSAVIARDTARVPWVSGLAVALFGYTVVAVTLRRRAQRRARRAVAGFARLPGEEQVLVVAERSVDAYSIEGPPSRIVVTAAMRDLLDARQYEALLAHEHAHLDGGHHRLVRLAQLAGAAHPALLGLAAQVDYLVERAADEHAAAHVGDRRAVAHAIGAAALAGHGAAAGGLHLAARPGAVPRRVRELLHPRRRLVPRLLLVLPAAPAVTTIVWTGEATIDLVELLRAAC